MALAKMEEDEWNAWQSGVYQQVLSGLKELTGCLTVKQLHIRVC